MRPSSMTTNQSAYMYMCTHAPTHTLIYIIFKVSRILYSNGLTFWRSFILTHAIPAGTMNPVQHWTTTWFSQHMTNHLVQLQVQNCQTQYDIVLELHFTCLNSGSSSPLNGACYDTKCWCFLLHGKVNSEFNSSPASATPLHILKAIKIHSH